MFCKNVIKYGVKMIKVRSHIKRLNTESRQELNVKRLRRLNGRHVTEPNSHLFLLNNIAWHRDQVNNK